MGSNSYARELRRSQIMSVYGPGAIVDISGESFVVCSIDTWRREGMELCNLKRLSDQLGVNDLMQPISSQGFDAQTQPSVMLSRFPRWLFCPKCRLMKHWLFKDEQQLTLGNPPSCEGCSTALTPMRYVRICENGHLSDVEWNKWVHRNDDGGNNPHQCDGGKLYFTSSETARGAALGTKQVVCRGCGIKKDAKLYEDGKCMLGCQPWEKSGRRCDATLKVVQRGDSNLHFANTMSALDIPVATIDNNNSLEQHEIDKIREDLRPAENLQRKYLEKFIIAYAKKNSLSLEVVKSVILGEEPQSGLDIQVNRSDIEICLQFKLDEFAALSNPEQSVSQNFRGTHYETNQTNFGVELSGLIDSISLLTRLREVRAFRGFHRLSPSGKDKMINASLNDDNWLPAYEVYGEGIFIKFNFDHLKEWQLSLPDIEIERIANLQQRLIDKSISFLPEPEPMFISLHGFSHILMKQLCFECGYAAASLRERLYVNNDHSMAGVLIYTADGDSEGTLGGLVRQGKPDKLPAIINRALHDAAWCSSDPLCREGHNQGLAGLNRSACHACLLVAETSCECANALLDRRLLVGDDREVSGLFESAMIESGIR